jgi:hypothetical protein
LAGCAVEEGMDLARNGSLYRATEYTATLPADRGVYLAPIADEREANVEAASGPYTVSYFTDGDWSRPPAVMVDEVVRRELESSGVFAGVQTRARPEDCLMRVKLRRFDVGAESHVTGWKSFAAIVLGVEVLGPVAASGDRPLWLQRDYAGAQKSGISWVPPAATGLMGLSVRQAVVSMLGDLDRSNVARANVPLDLERK